VTETLVRAGDAPGSTPTTRGEARPTLAVVGSGRAGRALAVALGQAGYRIVAVWSRDPGRAGALAEAVSAHPQPTPLRAMRAASVTLLTISDSAITGVAASVAATGACLRGRGIVHCSASRGREALAALRVAGAAVGALHPLQALSGPESANHLGGSLMAVDADPALLTPLHRMVVDIGGRAVVLPAGARAVYHAAAVLAGNAPLALLATAADLLAGEGVDRRLAEDGLAELMLGALANARRQGSGPALTGPIARGDTATVALHLAALRDHPGAGALYRALARATLQLAGTEGREPIAALLDAPDPAESDREDNH
jgi:predicted short-subunit dehydrogenase-like oxidoreductase (DUF2520 family)